MLTIDLDSPVPIAEQIVAGIRGEIAAGAVRAGDDLPTVRQLAADLGINQNTVSRAYRTLEASGLVRTTRGRGTVVVAERDVNRPPAARLKAGLADRLRAVLVDARLAGLDRRRLDALIAGEVRALWPEE